MAFMNKRDEFGWMAIALHWLLFLLVAGMTASGKYSASLSGDDKIGTLIATHKQIGIAVFLLMAFRFLWKMINTSPLSLSDSTVQNFLAFLVHWTLYIVVLAQALSGATMTQLGGHDLFFLGMEVPTLFGKDGLLGAVPTFLGTDSPRQLAGLLRNWHEYGGNAILGLVGMHMLAGFWHHLSGAEHLRRMWFGYKPPYARDTKSSK